MHSLISLLWIRVLLAKVQKKKKKVRMNEAIILLMSGGVSVTSVNYNPFGCDLAETTLLPLCRSFVVVKMWWPFSFTARTWIARVQKWKHGSLAYLWNVSSSSLWYGCIACLVQKETRRPSLTMSNTCLYNTEPDQWPVDGLYTYCLWLQCKCAATLTSTQLRAKH